MTIIAVGWKGFYHGGVRDSVDWVCVIPAHEHLDALKEGQRIDLWSPHSLGTSLFPFEKRRRKLPVPGNSGAHLQS